MLLIHFLFTSLLVANCFLCAPLNKHSKKCIRLTRADVRTKLGPPIKCLNDSKDVECFGHERTPTKVQFNSSDVVSSIEFSTYSGLHTLMQPLNQILPKENRGKFLQRFESPPPGSCQSVSEEEYACLRITYWQELCMGSAPASIKVTWGQTKIPSRGRAALLSIRTHYLR